MKIKILTAISSAFLFSTTAFAHEYWLEPENFFPATNEKTAVHLFVGDGLIKDREERPFQLNKTSMFQMFSGYKAWDLKSSIQNDAMPIYNFSADRPGNYLLAMERNWSYVKLEAAKFADYLREDGMEYILVEREKRDESQKEARERYSRFIKSLLQVGGKRDDIYKKQLGLKLEITPLENPYSKKVGDKLKFQVRFNGKPVVDRAVFAENRNSVTQKLITDKDGNIVINLSQNGLWLVRLVVMQRCESNCGEAEWESFWAAFSFGVK